MHSYQPPNTPNRWEDLLPLSLDAGNTLCPTNKNIETRGSASPSTFQVLKTGIKTIWSEDFATYEEVIMESD